MLKIYVLKLLLQSKYPHTYVPIDQFTDMFYF